ncbi:class I SAM-dependent methyltransferase [Patescibacteria group bacterium]
MIKRGTGGFLHPDKVLEQLNIYDNIKAADFGCGRGYFSIPLAKAIPNGTIYSFDVLEEALQAVRSKAEMEKINNIKTIRANLEVVGNSGLKDESMDLVVLANILYQSKRKEEIIREAKRVLKKQGRIILIEWMASTSLIPKGSGWQMISIDKAKDMAGKQGLKLVQELGKIDVQHYGLIFMK